MLLLLWACHAPPAPTHLPDAPTAPGADPVVGIVARPGIRDLRADLVGPGRYVWREDGALTELADTDVPARRVWPGSTWTVEATLDDGRVGSASHVVPEPPGGNVLVLLVDDVGVDVVGAYGGPFAARTPRIDALAAVGVRFTRAYASMVCSPTRGTLMTGRHPRRTGLGWVAEVGDGTAALPLASTTVPEALWEARGQETWSNGAIGKWHMAGDRAPDRLLHPNQSGFDHFAGLPSNPEYDPDRGFYGWSKNVNGVPEESTIYLTTAQVDDALARIAAMPEPWFLYVAFSAPHTPLHEPPAHLVAGALPGPDAAPELRYAAMLEATDTEIGRLLDSVDPQVLGRTTIVFAGDNGTSDSGTPDAVDVGRNKHTPYERGVRVPLIVAGPHVRAPGATSGALVHVADLLPTVADLAGVPLGGPDGEVLDLAGGPVLLDGRSLLPLLADPSGAGRTWVYAEAHSNGPGPYSFDRRALRDLTHKLVRRPGHDELYRLEGADELDVTELITTGAILSAEDVTAWDQLTEVMDGIEASVVWEGY